MAIGLVEGFHGGPGFVVGLVGLGEIVTGGPTGTYALKRVNTPVDGYSLDRTTVGVTGNAEAATLGCRIRPDNDLSKTRMITWDREDGATVDTLYVNHTSATTFSVALGSTSNIVGSFTTPGTVGEWFYLNVAWFSDPLAGTLKVRVNGETPDGWSDITGNTQANAVTATHQRVRLAYDSQNWRFADLVVMDGEKLRPFRVALMAPEATVTNDWTGSDGDSIDNHLLVDERPPSGSDFVESGTTGHVDRYALSAPGFIGTPLGVRQVVAASDPSGGGGSINIATTHAGTTDAGTDHALDVSTSVRDHITTDKPGGGTWTMVEIAEAELAVKVN